MPKLSKKTLDRSWIAYSQHNLTSMSFDRLQAFGYCWSMLPVINELYKDPQEIKQAMKRHSAFYNTEPQMGVIINGITIGMEEQRANGEPIDDTTINSIKLGLMGPIAGIGDSMIPGTFIPILLSIALLLSTNGSPAAYVNLNTTLSFQQNAVNIQVQTLIDNIFPKLLPLLAVLLCWYLMSKKGVSPIKMMLYLFLGTIVGVLLNVF